MVVSSAEHSVGRETPTDGEETAAAEPTPDAFVVAINMQTQQGSVTATRTPARLKFIVLLPTVPTVFCTVRNHRNWGFILGGGWRSRLLAEFDVAN